MIVALDGFKHRSYLLVLITNFVSSLITYTCKLGRATVVLDEDRLYRFCTCAYETILYPRGRIFHYLNDGTSNLEYLSGNHVQITCVGYLHNFHQPLPNKHTNDVSYV